jgi:acetyl-CoA acetyltransferase
MDVAIVGIGLHPFGRFEGVPGIEFGAHAARLALQDAGIEWKDIQFAFGGSFAAAAPDSLVSHLGLTGIPFTNVQNGCATGGSALVMAYNALQSGQWDLGMVVGFDKHPRGAFNADPSIIGLPQWYGDTGLMITTQFFAMKANRYMHDHGISREALAMVAAKNFRNGARNPNAWRRKEFGVEEILESGMLNYPLSRLMYCAPDEGGAAMVVCRAEDAHRYTDTPIYLKAAVVRTRRFGAFEVLSPWLPVEDADSPTVDAAQAAYEMAGIGPGDVAVAQVQDTEAAAEIMHMAENGFCEHGEQEAMVRAGETEIGGRLPVNTDGGLIANGEPIGASALRQVYETVLQLRGQAGERQVPGDPRVGYTQVYGGPGTAAVTILTR